MPGTRRLIVALNLSYSFVVLAIQAHAILDAMTGNAWFPAPHMPLSQLADHLADLDAACAAMHTKTKGTVDVRKAMKKLVVADLQQLKAYVQSISDTNEASSELIIESAGMSFRTHTPRQKNIFKAKQRGISGVVFLTAVLAPTDASYHWQWCTTQGDWFDLPPTMQANTSVAGLVPATIHYFRYRTVTRTGWTDWSQTLALLVT